MSQTERHTCPTTYPEKVYVVLGYCGDYYCDGEHLVGVFTQKEVAEAIKPEDTGRAFGGYKYPRLEVRDIPLDQLVLPPS